jgi:signal transduction histidine kinase
MEHPPRPLVPLIVTDDIARRERIAEIFASFAAASFAPLFQGVAQTARASAPSGKEVAGAVIDCADDPMGAVAAAFRLRRELPGVGIALMAPSPGFPVPVEMVELSVGPLITGDDDGLSSLPNVILAMTEEETDDAASRRDLRLRHQELRDITDSLARQSVHLIRLRNELAAEKNKFETVINGAADGIAYYDNEGRLELVNPVARDLFFDLGSTAPTALDALLALLAERRVDARNESADAFEAAFGESTYRVRLSHVADSRGEPAGSLVSFVDVTGDKEYEKLKNDFTSMISHELRTPLTSIRASVDNFLRGNLGEVTDRQRKFLEMIARNVDRQQALIDDLLDLAKFEAGRMEVKREPTKLSAVLSHCVEQFALAFRDKGVDLTLAPNEPVTLPVDTALVTQALANLLSNALKFTDAGGSVTVSLSVDGDRFARVAVADTGIGVPPEKQATIFDKYTQVDSGERRRYPGTGLGLAIVREIAHAHGGRIAVESRTGAGARFILSLPLSEENP